MTRETDVDDLGSKFAKKFDREKNLSLMIRGLFQYQIDDYQIDIMADILTEALAADSTLNDKQSETLIKKYLENYDFVDGKLAGSAYHSVGQHERKIPLSVEEKEIYTARKDTFKKVMSDILQNPNAKISAEIAQEINARVTRTATPTMHFNSPWLPN
jgi:hypothetical protein